jgi:hypothetical protein
VHTQVRAAARTQALVGVPIPGQAAVHTQVRAAARTQALVGVPIPGQAAVLIAVQVEPATAVQAQRTLIRGTDPLLTVVKGSRQRSSPMH